MVIYKKKFSSLCYISRPNRLPTKYPEIADTIWQKQARSQVSRFGEKILG